MYENEIEHLTSAGRRIPGPRKDLDTAIALMRAAEPKDEAAEREHVERVTCEMAGNHYTIDLDDVRPLLLRERAAVRAECQVELNEQTAEILRLDVRLADARAEIERLKAQVNTMITTVAQKGPPRCAELHTYLVQHMPPSLLQRQLTKPNPHPEGSYMWAYEETQRGRQVKRKCGRCWPTDGLLEHDDFITTDWVLC